MGERRLRMAMCAPDRERWAEPQARRTNGQKLAAVSGFSSKDQRRRLGTSLQRQCSVEQFILSHLDSCLIAEIIISCSLVC